MPWGQNQYGCRICEVEYATGAYHWSELTCGTGFFMNILHLRTLVLQVYQNDAYCF